MNISRREQRLAVFRTLVASTQTSRQNSFFPLSHFWTKVAPVKCFFAPVDKKRHIVCRRKIESVNLGTIVAPNG